MITSSPSEQPTVVGFHTPFFAFFLRVSTTKHKIAIDKGSRPVSVDDRSSAGTSKNALTTHRNHLLKVKNKKLQRERAGIVQFYFYDVIHHRPIFSAFLPVAQSGNQNIIEDPLKPETNLICVFWWCILQHVLLVKGVTMKSVSQIYFYSPPLLFIIFISITHRYTYFLYSYKIETKIYTTYSIRCVWSWD